MHHDVQLLQGLREAAIELLLAWDGEHPLLPDTGLETEADLADAAVCHSLMLDMRHALPTQDPAALVANCAKLVTHHRAVEGRALWSRFDAIGQTKYGRLMAVLEQHLRALAHVLPETQETGAIQP